MPMLNTSEASSHHDSKPVDVHAQHAQRAHFLHAASRRALDRAERKLQKQLVESEESSKGLWYRQIADSIMASPATYPRGSSTVELTNLHTNQVDRVKLNPKLDGRENADLLYKKARKALRSAEIVGANLIETRAEIERLTVVDQHCAGIEADTAISDDERALLLEKLAARLADLGAIPKPRTADGIPGTAEGPRVPYMHFTVDGYDVYAGKNATQNDELSTRFTKPWDVWMHVAAHSGSHVIIRRDKNGPWPPQDVLVKVAAMTVWFSKAKHTSYAEVHVTEGRFVRKRRHAPAGEVLAERCKTIRVAPKSPQELFSETKRGEQ